MNENGGEKGNGDGAKGSAGAVAATCWGCTAFHAVEESGCGYIVCHVNGYGGGRASGHGDLEDLG